VAVCVTGLLRQWCQELPYVHRETGTPRNLRFDEGEPSLVSLLRTHLPGMPAHEALALVEEHGAVARQPDGSYLPVQRGRTFTGLAIELVSVRACQYLQAGLRNLLQRDSTQGYADRVAGTFRLPLRFLEEFRRLSDQQLHYLTQVLDSWLSDRESRDTDEPCALVNVHGYVYVDDAPRAPGPARSRYR
jgi:hypothetical protein